ncbi:uncharacterized protein N7482_001650 [Penicillium canariense]|uniref:Major facilitator superfamily (MFS) profile domain-containing protein n=1 Tax=Penicillium canariense TaxID=189055 RepID=A0A9W9LT55_9EURO|nr:uncharacterized protein N7482_001650 [Penicillium canariense]KAJ5175773.1 hypothetical protein N7482_001650 [Penicillium canariense]
MRPLKMKFRSTAWWQRLAALPFVRHFTLPLGLAIMVLALSVLSNGFDLSVYNSIQAMDAFDRRFGKCNAKGVCALDTFHLAMLNSFPLIAYAVGLLIATLIGERFGRRTVFVAMNVVCLIGIITSYTAQSFVQIFVGRLLVNAYVGMESWLVPLFQAEIVPAKVRGAVVSCYLLGRLLGSFLISCVGYKTAHWAGDTSWRTPLAVLFSIPPVCLCLTFLIPESPRWLVRVGKDEKALQNLRYLHDGDGVDVEMELVLLKESLTLDTEGGGWLDLFRGSNTGRTAIAMITNFFGQATGQSFVNNYGTIFFKTLGVNPFLVTMFSTLAALVGAALFLVLVDRVGRRRFWQTSAPLCALIMLVIGGLGVKQDPSANQKLAIATLFPIWGIFYLSSFAQLAALTPAEIPSLSLREKTAMMGWSVQNLTNFVSTFTVPYLINAGHGNLHAKVGFVYGAIGMVGVIWAFFYYPELKGRSLEEIDEMLRQKIPARKTAEWRMARDGIAFKLAEISQETNADPEEKGGGILVENTAV